MEMICYQLKFQLIFFQFLFGLGLIEQALSQTYAYPDRLPDEFPQDAYNHMNFTTKCIGDLGCFYTGPPFYHPLFRPYSTPPELHPTKFLLYTRSNRKNPYELQISPSSLKMSPYDGSAPMKVLIHGYEENTTIYDGIIDELLNHAPYNIINVNWTLSDGPPYHVATANARVVGAYVAKLIKFIMDQTGLSPERVHLVGHSTGGHLVGYVGERIPNLGRITGLDPAGIYFYNAPKEVRLDRGDAQFVDVIQTNIGVNYYHGIGLEQLYGHADFRVNGGNHQPGCDYQPAIPLTEPHNPYIIQNQCSHLRSLDYFQYSINTCQYTSLACFSYDGFEAGLCDTTPFRNRMGLYAKKPPYQLQYYLDTASQAPYCEVPHRH